MSVLERAALEESPLADLHTIASELSIDSYRRLRKEQLIDAILERQGGEASAKPAEAEDAEESDKTEEAEESDEAAGSTRRRRGRRGGRRSSQAAEADEPGEPAPDRAAEGRQKDDEVVEGQVELMTGGSAFLRVNPPETSDEDIYISAAQVKRCELVSGDRISGPRRAPRRSERYASLYRIDTVNGRPAAEVADGVRFDDLPAVFPTERFAFASGDETLKAIESLTPIGKGSRVTIVGPARSGKTETLRRIASALAGQDGLETSVVLAGVRPEEIGTWAEAGIEPAQTTTLAASSDVQGQAVATAIDQARRIAARGSDVVVVIDALDGLQPHAARRALASARNIADGGSLTVIASATEPFGGETTVIALDEDRVSMGQFPALDLDLSGTLRAELLVGGDGLAAIRQARAEAGAFVDQ